MALNYRPYERDTLEALLAGVHEGLPGQSAYGIFSDIQQGALERAQQQRGKHMALQQLLPEMAGFASQTASAGLPSSVIESAYGGYQSPMIQGSLEQLLGGLYPGGADVSPYAQTQTEGLEGLDPESVSNIAADVQAAVQQGKSLHQTRMAIMTQLRLQGVPEATLQQVFDFIGKQYELAGGEVGPPEPTGGGGWDLEGLLRTGSGALIGGVLGGLVGHPKLGAVAGAAGLNWLANAAGGMSPDEARAQVQQALARGEITPEQAQEALSTLARL